MCLFTPPKKKQKTKHRRRVSPSLQKRDEREKINESLVLFVSVSVCPSRPSHSLKLTLSLYGSQVPGSNTTASQPIARDTLVPGLSWNQIERVRNRENNKTKTAELGGFLQSITRPSSPP